MQPQMGFIMYIAISSKLHAMVQTQVCGKMLWHIRISSSRAVKWTRKLALKVYLQSALSPDWELRHFPIDVLNCSLALVILHNKCDHFESKQAGLWYTTAVLAPHSWT